MGSDGNPVGGKWSFDEDNRKKLPKGTKVPAFPKINLTIHTKKLKNIVEKKFLTQNMDLEIIFIDDGSGDNSFEELLKIKNIMNAYN